MSTPADSVNWVRASRLLRFWLSVKGPYRSPRFLWCCIFIVLFRPSTYADFCVISAMLSWEWVPVVCGEESTRGQKWAF